MDLVKASDIYKDILQRQGYTLGTEAAESLTRNLRNKMNFLLEQVALRKVSDFKKGNATYVPSCDAAIVRNLLMCSIESEGIIVDWFNSSLDLTDSYNCILLYGVIQEPIRRAEMTGEADGVTVDEWLASIRGLINYDMARNTEELKRKLEDFRVNTLVRNSTVRFGDVYSQNEMGYRQYAIEREERKVEIPHDLLEQLVANLHLQDDYFRALNQIMSYMVKDAEKKAIPDIETYAMAKSISEEDKMYKLIEGVSESIVSEYYPWFQKIAQFLKRNPDIAKRIEKEIGTNNLSSFFEMK